MGCGKDAPAPVMPVAPPVAGFAEEPEALLLAGVTGFDDSPPQAAKPKAPKTMAEDNNKRMVKLQLVCIEKLLKL